MLYTVFFHRGVILERLRENPLNLIRLIPAQGNGILRKTDGSKGEQSVYFFRKEHYEFTK